MKSTADGLMHRPRYTPSQLSLSRNRLLPFGERTLLMGRVRIASTNTGPGAVDDEPSERALAIVEQGADIVSIEGGHELAVAVETDRVLAVVETLQKNTDAGIAVITREPGVASEAVGAGADIIDDLDGFAGTAMRSAVAETGAIALLRHTRIASTSGMAEARYEKIVLEVKAELGARIASLRQAGTEDQRIWIDPGLGLDKNEHHDAELMRRLDEFHLFEKPIAVTFDRTGFVRALLREPDLAPVEATVAGAVMAALQGAHIIRVEEVAETVRAIQTINAIQLAPAG